jgi:hypothetical protein
MKTEQKLEFDQATQASTFLTLVGLESSMNLHWSG